MKQSIIVGGDGVKRNWRQVKRNMKKALLANSKHKWPGGARQYWKQDFRRHDVLVKYANWL